MPDYILAADDEFNAWQDNFVTYANAHLAEQGLVEGYLSPNHRARFRLAHHVLITRAKKHRVQPSGCAASTPSPN